MWTMVQRAALAAALYSCAMVTTSGTEQARQGSSLLAEFRAWQKTQPDSDDWARLLDRYRTKLVGDGRSADAADRAIRIITAYDEAELYDSIYAKGVDFNTAPNQFLVDVTSTLRAGRALDVGMGMGRNALHLARKGWDVTGFDVSAVGVQHAQATAKAERLTLQAVVAADEEFEFGRAQWDLVLLATRRGLSACYRRSACKPCGPATDDPPLTVATARPTVSSRRSAEISPFTTYHA